MTFLDSSVIDTALVTSSPWLPPLGGRQCSSLDGQHMDEGQTWWDGCRKCFCHEGHEMCALVACPALRCPNPVMRIGSCCLSCPGKTSTLFTHYSSFCLSHPGKTSQFTELAKSCGNFTTGLSVYVTGEHLVGH